METIQLLKVLPIVRVKTSVKRTQNKLDRKEDLPFRFGKKKLTHTAKNFVAEALWYFMFSVLAF